MRWMVLALGNPSLLTHGVLRSTLKELTGRCWNYRSAQSGVFTTLDPHDFGTFCHEAALERKLVQAKLAR